MDRECLRGATVDVMTTAGLIAAAQGGDADAFRELMDPHRRELLAHCYRILGSFHDAEDAVQDTLLAAWQNLGRFEARSSIRTWVYRIATNRCLNALRAARRRPVKEWDVPGAEPPRPTGSSDVVWLEPFPDALWAGGVELGPEARYEQTESMSLAFVTAVQLLPARQRAVLVLRDVLGFRAEEVAGMLDTTVDAVHSGLKRARLTLAARLPADAGRAPAPVAGSAAEQALADAFVKAYRSGDVAAVVALMTEDVRVTMPPMPFEYEGRDVVQRFLAALSSCRTYHLVPTRANGQLAFGTYLQTPGGGIRHGAGLLVLTLAGDRICALTRFESGVLPSFGLPRSLPVLDR